MKKELIFILVLVKIFLLTAQELMEMPEGISYDQINQRYLVSCWNNAAVIEIDSQGNESYFVQGLPHCANNLIVDDILYVTYMNGVKGFALVDGSEVFSRSLPGAVDPDGIAQAQDGFLYVLTHNKKIYKIDLQEETYELYVSGNLGNYPQGMIYDPFHNRLLTCSYQTDSPIFTVDLPLGLTYELVQTQLDNLDAMAIDDYGSVYVSCNGNNSIYRFDNDFSSDPVIVSSGHSGPSGLEVNEQDNILAVSNFFTNCVDFVIIEFSGFYDNIIESSFPKLAQNYPNPFNPLASGSNRNQDTVINYQISKISRILLSVYNIKGQLIKILVDEVKSPGLYSASWDAKDRREQPVVAGLYFYTLKSNNKTLIRKMMLFK